MRSRLRVKLPTQKGKYAIMTPQDGGQPNLRSRGIAYQAVGFGIIGIASALILFAFEGSEHWTYRLFDLCATKLYWAFLAPLAAIFDKVRDMFETRGEIRQRMFDEGVQAGIAQTRSNMERAGLPQDVIDSILADQRRAAPSYDDDIDPRIKRYIDQRLSERENGR